MTLIGYDSRGNRTVAIGANGNSTLQILDGASRQLETQQLMRENGLGTQGPQAANSTFLSAGRGLVRTQMLYDGNSRMFQLIDDRGATTDYTFDTLDRQLTMMYADGSTQTNVYNTASDIVTYTDANGSIFNNTWDCLGRKTNTAITPAPGIGGTTSQTFQYDGLSRPTQNQDISGAGTVQVSFFYDSLGRAIEEAPITLGTGGRYVTNTAFTSMPSTQFEYPNNRLVNSGYDVLYRRKQVIEQSTSAVIATWQFYGPGRIAEVTLGNGIAQTMLNNARTNSAVQSPAPVNPAWGDYSSDRLGYDGAARNITKRYLFSALDSQNGYANTIAIVGTSTAYDRAGNKFYEHTLQVQGRDNLYQPVDNNGNIASPIPGYDSLNRLLQYQRGTLSSTGGYQNAGGGSVTSAITLPNTDSQRNYNLDGLGNWKTSTYTPVGGSSTTDQRNHNYVNEITQQTITGNAPYTPQYDANGNAVSIGLTSQPFDRVTIQYDALNRPIEIRLVSDGGIIALYTYDATNRRVRKYIGNGGATGNIPDGTIDYVWLGNQVMEERNPFGGSGSTDTPIKQYIWGTYIDECIQLTTLATLGPQNVPAGSYYLLQDLLYRAMALTDASGAIVEAYDTDAYGNTIIMTANWGSDSATQSAYGANDLVFCGYRYDPETQMYYVRNRTYSPTLGRWIQRDPIGYAGGINLYEYVAGRAVASLDPMGTWEVDAGVYAAASGSVDFMSGEVTLGGWLWAGIGFQFGQRWWGWSFYTQGVLLHRRFGFLDWITPGKCACGVRGNWWSTGPGSFATLSPGQNNGIRFGPIELGALLLVQPGGDKATIEGVFIWNAVKDLPAGWAVVKVLHFLHLHAAVDIIGTFSFEICPRKGGGITADKAIGSISLALHLGHAPGNIGR